MQSDQGKCNKAQCVSCSKNFCACLFSHIGLSGLVVAYTILGGFLFYQIEVSSERVIKEKARELRNITEQKFVKMLSLTNLASTSEREKKLKGIREILDEFEKNFTSCIFDHGWNGRYDNDDLNWSYEGSVLYSVTVITTIGYGHTTPKTITGRILTIFYAIFGIPLTFLYLNNIGNYLAQIFRLVYSQICYPICMCFKRTKRRRTKHNGDVSKLRISAQSSIQVKSSLNDNNNTNTDLGSVSSKKLNPSCKEPLSSLENAKINCWNDLENIKKKLEKSEETKIEVTKNQNIQSYIEEIPTDSEEIEIKSIPGDTVPLTLTMCIMVSYIALGAFLFTFWDDNDNDYMKWSYFCFITLSTIGFGDIVPGTTINDKNPKEKLIVSVLYVAIGLPVFAMCFKLMEDEIVNKVKSFARKIGISKS